MRNRPAVAANLFCYGTLCDAAVIGRIAGRVPIAKPAVLPDYAAYLLHGKSYPAVIKRPGAVTEGLLYINLSLREIQCLDRYEAGEYQRQQLSVRSPVSPLQLAAWVYVLHPACRALLSRQPWHLESMANRNSAVSGARGIIPSRQKDAEQARDPGSWAITATRPE